MNAGLKNIKILVINQSLGSMFHDLIEDLAAEAMEVAVICGTKEKFAEKNVHIIQGPEYIKRNTISRILSWTKFLIFVFRKILLYDKSWLLIISSNPPMLPWIGWFFNKIRGQRYIVRVLDIYPDIVVQRGQIPDWNPIILFWRWLNRKAYSRAERLVTLGPYMVATISKYLCDTNQKQVVLIPDWANINKITPIKKEQNPFAEKYFQTDCITVQYSGNIGLAHDISLMVKAAHALQDDSRFHFMIIGEGPAKLKLDAYCRHKKLKNISFLPFQDNDSFKYSLAAADIGVASIGKGSEGVMMPCKTYFSMAVGAAILGISYPPNDLAAIIEENECGINVAPDDLESAVKALKRFADEPLWLQECKTNSRKAAEEKFCRKVNTTKLINLIDAVVNC